jgi:hypothetical protein
MTWPIALIITNYGVLVAEAVSLVALVPLFCYTPIRSRGLGFDEMRIGGAMSIRAVTTIIFQVSIMVPF